MNEKELILKKGEQPVAKISDKELEFLIQRDFANNAELVKQKLNKIQSDSQNGKNRISAVVLKIANSDLTKIDFLSRKRERIINVVEVKSFTVYTNLNSLFCSF